MSRTLHAFICKVCGAEFLRRARARRPPTYCSKRCVWSATKGPEYNADLARRTNAAKADAIRGTGSRGYVKLNGRHEHRSAAERILGRALARGEIVHHVDGDKKNNEPSNLRIMTQAEHMREHGLGIKGMKLWWKPWEKRGRSHE